MEEQQYTLSDSALIGAVRIMPNKLSVLAVKTVEVMFFIGLAGCVVTVILSWISVVKGCFKDKI
jgi:hypothetical protein